MKSTQPIICVKNLCKTFPAGEETVVVLNNVSFSIQAGESVAIVGSSGSGKSTLMNILGCLDHQTTGEYLLNGVVVKQLESDALAALRRDYFGFIFQRYHLMTSLTALENVEIPAIYAGRSSEQRASQAAKILAQLGMQDKMQNYPNQLSGGQQQRVSIARALMNGGQIILADEPTGALDSHNGAQVMQILRDLHALGHTLIIVTHDKEVANYANRMIEIKDGCIIADVSKGAEVPAVLPAVTPTNQQSWLASWYQFKEAFKMAVHAITAHKMRSFLTMLGIIIGIASVVSVVALGQGSQQKILASINNMGTNTIDVYPGSGFGDRGANAVRTLTLKDAELLAKQVYIHSVSPNITTNANAIYGNLAASVQVRGGSAEFFQVKDMQIETGSAFDEAAVQAQTPNVVIDKNTQKTFFKAGENPIGKILLIKNVPARIIGIAKDKANSFGSNDRLNVWMPYTTVASRLTGNSYLQNITVRVRDETSMRAAEAGMIDLLTEIHGKKDFFTSNSDSIRETVEQTTQTMTLLISAIAVISLIVGGIGVMNIMLVSVTERTKEIGIRMAIGAKKQNILQQFLMEAVLVCLTGGVIGVGLSLGLGLLFNQFSKDFTMVYSTASIVLAFLCSSLIGVVFGFLPANNAAKLDPIVALARE